MPQLSDMYDADKRTTDDTVRDTAAIVKIPHPIPGVTYADGHYADTAAGHVRTPQWLKEPVHKHRRVRGYNPGGVVIDEAKRLGDLTEAEQRRAVRDLLQARIERHNG